MSELQQVNCPHCHRANRVPCARLVDRPKCGACKNPLFGIKPIELSAAAFSRQVAPENLPLLVDFWASWCGPCQMMAPEFEKAAVRFDTRVRFAKLNTETEQSVAANYNIRSIPTLILFKGGKEVARQAGAMNAPQIAQWLDAVL